MFAEDLPTKVRDALAHLTQRAQENQDAHVAALGSLAEATAPSVVAGRVPLDWHEEGHRADARCLGMVVKAYEDGDWRIITGVGDGERGSVTPPSLRAAQDAAEEATSRLVAAVLKPAAPQSPTWPSMWMEVTTHPVTGAPITGRSFVAIQAGWYALVTEPSDGADASVRCGPLDGSVPRFPLAWRGHRPPRFGFWREGAWPGWALALEGASMLLADAAAPGCGVSAGTPRGVTL